MLRRLKLCSKTLSACRSTKQLLFQGTCRIVSQQNQHFSNENDSKETEQQFLSPPHEKKSKEEKDELVEIQHKILAASLPFVPEHGWTKAAISAGAECIGYPGVIHGIFPNGGIELVQYFYLTSNQKLVNMLKDESEESAKDISKQKPVNIFVQNAVETRLRMIIPYIDKWPQAIGMMSLPPNIPSALANLLTLVDDICYYAGDRSVDFNWYTRRITLAGIYKATELYFIQDKSDDFQETWKFLNRRIDEASQIHHYFKRSEDASLFAKEAVSAAFITARNILGLELGRR